MSLGMSVTLNVHRARFGQVCLSAENDAVWFTMESPPGQFGSRAAVHFDSLQELRAFIAALIDAVDGAQYPNDLDQPY